MSETKGIQRIINKVKVKAKSKEKGKIEKFLILEY
jgi:hypothetical protein